MHIARGFCGVFLPMPASSDTSFKSWWHFLNETSFLIEKVMKLCLDALSSDGTNVQGILNCEMM